MEKYNSSSIQLNMRNNALCDQEKSRERNKHTEPTSPDISPKSNLDPISHHQYSMIREKEKNQLNSEEKNSTLL